MPANGLGEWSLRLGIALLGVLLFAFQVFLAFQGGVRSAPDRESRIEAAGAIVPGLAGLFIVVAALSPWPAVSIGMASASLVFLVFGRAAYELIVFRARNRT